MEINNEVNKNKIISEDDSETKNLIEKRIKKYKSKLPESYWSETSWALRTKPPKKRLKTNPGIPLRLSKIVFEKDSENEWSTQHFIEKQKYAGKNKSRRMPCRKCPRCLAPKCRECKMCLNPKFKKPCINRTCFSKLEPIKDEDTKKAAEVDSAEVESAKADDDENKSLLALLDQELKDDKEDNESDPDTPIFDEIDEENDEKAKNDVKKSQLALQDVNEEEEDNDPDGWGDYINHIKQKKHDEIDEENDEQAKEKYNEKPKNDASTSTGKKDHDGVPPGRQQFPYLLSDLCKPKNGKTYKRPFKGIAYC